MKRVGIFIDVTDIYYHVIRHYRNRKLSYRSYLDFVEDFGDVVQAVAYGSQSNNDAAGFIRALKKIGYQTKFREIKNGYETQWNVAIAMDVVQMAPRLDLVVLGSADPDLEPLVGWCKRQGISVYVIACNIGNTLRECATECIEIPESLLEDKKNAPAKTKGE